MSRKSRAEIAESERHREIIRLNESGRHAKADALSQAEYPGRVKTAEELAALAALNVRRAADREKMAAALTAVLVERGANCDRRGPAYGPREIVLDVQAPGGAHCYVYFDGASTQPDTWVVTWNAHRPLTSAVGDLNTSHRRKATRVFVGFTDLLHGMCADVERFADGTGYAS